MKERKKEENTIEGQLPSSRPEQDLELKIGHFYMKNA